MSFRRHMLRHGLRISVLAASIGAAVAAGGLSGTAWAQDIDVDAEEDEAGQAADEEVIVTGTRIRRNDYSSPNAMSVVSSEDMQALGVISVADMISQLPNNVAAISPEANAGSAFNVGATIANLRGLNTFSGTRTLTMVDSRRFVATNNGGAVDMNVIPTALVGRIETVTGGGSATYGADAMAGVVNVILDTDIDGYVLELGTQTTSEGDGDRYNFSFATGTPLLDDRAQFTVSLDHSSQDGIDDCLTREYCRRSLGLLSNGEGVPAGFFQPPAPYSNRVDVTFVGQPHWMIMEGMRHTNLPEGMLFEEGYTTDCLDQSCGTWRITPDGKNVVPYLDELTPEQRTAVDVESWTGETPWGLGKSPYAAVPLRPETTRTNFFSRFDYELDNGINFRTDVSFARTENQVLQKQSSVNMQGFCIREDNGFLQQSSQAMQDLFAARWMTGVFTPFNSGGFNDWSIVCDEPPYLGGSFRDDREEGRFDFGPGTVIYKDMSEHLDRQNNNTTDVSTFTMNVNGDLGQRWTWDTYWTWGNSESETFIRDWRSDNRMQMALDSVVDPNTGEVVCRINAPLEVRGYNKWAYDPNANGGAGGIVNTGGDDIRDKWVTFYRLALAEEYSDEELEEQANIWFNELSEGCRPFNPFGSAEDVPIPADVKAFAFPSIIETTDIKQNAISVNFSGDLHQGIGAGPLRMATGLDWRREDTVNRTGDDIWSARDFQSNFNGANAFGDNWSGRSENAEIYAEIEMPFLRDKKAADYLMVNIANRRTRNESTRLEGRDLVSPISFTRYVSSWKASMVWQPVSFMRLRMTRSHDMRAPSSRELFQTNTGAQQAGGQNEIRSIFRVDDETTQQAEDGEQYENITGGNSQLKSETAISETLGLVFTPQLLPGLEVAIDYYETTVSGGIERVGTNGTVTRCASQEIGQNLPEEEWVFCRNIVFGPPDVSQVPIMAAYGCEDPETGALGCSEEEIARRLPYTNIESIASSMVNEAPYWNRGFDLSLSYNKQLGGGGFLYGRVLATRYLEQSVELGGVRGRQNVAGQTGSNGLNRSNGAFDINYSPTPNISGNAYMSYSKNAFTVTGQVRYIGTGRLNVQDGWIGVGECATYLEDDVPQTACYDPAVIDTVSDASLPSWTTLNLNFNYDFTRSRFQFDRFETLSMFLNIENVADRVPDFFSGRGAGGVNTAYFSGMGREYNVGVRMEF